jgi:hypothetical protein
MVAKSHRLFPQHYIDEKNPCVRILPNKAGWNLPGMIGWRSTNGLILDHKASSAAEGRISCFGIRYCSYPVLGAALTTRPVQVLLLL